MPKITHKKLLFESLVFGYCFWVLLLGIVFVKTLLVVLLESLDCDFFVVLVVPDVDSSELLTDVLGFVVLDVVVLGVVVLGSVVLVVISLYVLVSVN